MQRIPILPAYTEIGLPTPPVWEVENVIVMTPDEVETYRQFCEIFTTPEDELGENQKEQKQSLIEGGSDADDFCQWAVYGFDVQNWLTFEDYMIQVATYVDKLKQVADFYKSQLEARQNLVEEAEQNASSGSDE